MDFRRDASTIPSSLINSTPFYRTPILILRINTLYSISAGDRDQRIGFSGRWFISSIFNEEPEETAVLLNWSRTSSLHWTALILQTNKTQSVSIRGDKSGAGSTSSFWYHDYNWRIVLNWTRPQNSIKGRGQPRGPKWKMFVSHLYSNKNININKQVLNHPRGKDLCWLGSNFLII